MFESKVKCASGHSNPAGQQYCGQCGATLAGLCPDGHRNSGTPNYCGACGKSMTTNAGGQSSAKPSAMPSSAVTGSSTAAANGRGALSLLILFACGLLVVAVIIAGAGSCGKEKSSGNSESYKWGTMAGNSAVTLVNNGVPLEQACDTQISVASMYADEPILNQTPPPKNFSLPEAKRGCMDQLHKKFGY